MTFDAHTRNAQFLAFDQSGSSSAKRVQEQSVTTKGESLDVVLDQVRRERKNKAIPVVTRTVFGLESVRFWRDPALKPRFSELESGL